jgi:hypothetical protein
VSFALYCAALLLPAADTTLAGQVVTVTKTNLTIAYLSRDGRTLRAKLKLTDKTEVVKDGKPVERGEVRVGKIVHLTLTRDRTVTRIKLPDTPVVQKEDFDEEVIVDGEIVSYDPQTNKMVLEKTNGKTLGVTCDGETEVKLDGVKKDLSALKAKQTIRADVLKKARTVTRVFIYEVTTRR